MFAWRDGYDNSLSHNQPAFKRKLGKYSCFILIINSNFELNGDLLLNYNQRLRKSRNASGRKYMVHMHSTFVTSQVPARL